MTINIPNGNTLTIVPSDSSARYSQLTGDDWIELKWESPEYVEIPTGSSVEFQGVTYTVERPQDVNIVNRRNYEYTVRFDTVAARLKYIKYINPDDGRVEFSVTGDANVHLNMLIRGANQLSGENWTAGNSVIGGKEATINYDGLYLYDAIELIAETFATEFEIAGTAIYIRKVEYNKSLPLNLSYGHGIGNGLQPGIKRRNYGDRPKVVALAVKGGNRNLNTSTNQNAYDAKTLHMPVELSNGIPIVIGYDGHRFAYSDSWSQGTGYSYREDTGFDGSLAKYYVIGNGGRMLYYAGTNGTSPTMPALIAGTDMDVADLTWIYPSVTHTVTAVETRQETVTSPDGGSETYTAYNIKIQTTIDYHDAIIPGSSSLEVIFQTGQLTGKEFDANFSLESGIGTFVIISKFIDDERMPGGTFVPAVGDTFRVFNCMLPQAYIREDSDNSGAEWEMAREAVKILWNKGGIHYTWEADLSGIYAANLPQASFDKIRIGGYVSFSDPEVQPEDLLIRISEIKQPLNHPKWVEIKLEDFSRIRRRRRNEAVESSRAQMERQQIGDDIAQIESDVSLRPSISQVEGIIQESTGRERAAHTNTSSYWAEHSDVVPAVGDMYVYSDGGSIEQSGVTVNIPKIKIGDGVTSLGNLPFTDSDTQQGTAGTLNTTNTSAQTPSASESLSGNVNLHKVAKTGSYEDLNNKPTIPAELDDLDDVVTNDVSGGDILVYRAGKVGSFVNVKLNDVALPADTKYAASLSLSVDSSTYVVTAQLKDRDGNNIGSAQTIDLPLESVVVGGSYNSQTKKVVLTLQNGSTIEFSVADLIAGLQSEITAQNPLSADLVTDGNTNKVLTSAEKTKLAGIEAGAEVNVQSDWNQSDNTADDFIKNKPTIPTKIDDLEDVFVDDSRLEDYDVLVYSETHEAWENQQLHIVAHTGDYNQLNNKPTIPTVPTNVSAFANDAGYITKSDLPTIDTDISETSTNPVQNKAIGVELRKLWQNFDVASRLGNDYEASDNYIAASGNYEGQWRPSTTYKHYIIPIYGIRLVIVEANTENSSYPTFLKSYTVGETGMPDYATGYDGCIEVPTGTDKSFVVPSDAQYMYINTGQNEAAKPLHVYLTGVGVTEHSGDGSGFVKDNGMVDKGTYLKQSDLPAIPSKTSDLTNDIGFITLNDIPSQEQSDWNEADASDPAYIKNKPALFSGDYNDLTNKPTIPTVPTNVSSFINDAGYLTQETDPVFSAWDKDYEDLKNTPVGGNGIELKSLVSDEYNVIIWSANESNTYINTEIAMSQDDIEMELVVKPTVGSWYIWQTRPSGGSTTGISGSSTNDTITFAFCGTTLTSGIRRYANTAYKYLVRAKAKNGNMNLYVKRLDTGVDDTKTGTYTYTQQTLPLYMFGNQRGDRVNRGNYIYSAKMWLGGKLVLDYVPVMRKSDDTIMFFDTRAQSFITPNSGSLYKASEDYLLPTPLAINAVAKGITIYSGSSAPSSVTGADGDIYIQEVV